VTPNKKKKGATQRLDALLVERGLAESAHAAQAMILAGEVRVQGQAHVKAGALVASGSRIEIVGGASRFASRGGEKLEGALKDFGVSVEDKVCLDVGASTGGFTDCLLQHGARRVYAVDVSSDQLDWRLRQDARVVPIERNARYLKAGDLVDAAGADIVTIDVSFISVATILPAVVSAARQRAEASSAPTKEGSVRRAPDRLAASTEFLILVKPQFELPRGDVAAGGIVRDAALHEFAIERVRAAAVAAGLSVIGVHPSRLMGAEGNQEFFLHARASRTDADAS
jgi:23S rRNA (cytidine1920-2'-O)/16S rRNA (cytidine1409-2'-O)-methyltransferase